jgi:hypothetical protein
MTFIAGAMNHATKTSTDTSPLDHDLTSRHPSKSSQPPIAMAPRTKIDTTWASSDTRIYYAKKYRQVLASAPACALAVMAGVSLPEPVPETYQLTNMTQAPLENLKVRMQS